MNKSNQTGTDCRRTAPAPLAGVFCLLLAGCTSVTTHQPGGGEVVMSREEFEHYVEQVFRYHNQVMNSLIESASERSEQSADEARKLSAAEQEMISTCQPLNEIVSDSMTGQSSDLKLKMGLSETVPACEKATQAVDDLIP